MAGTLTIYRWESFWSAWGEDTIFLIPILLGMFLVARRRPADQRSAHFLIFAVLGMTIWRVLYAWSMQGGVRYQAPPVILALPVVISGLYVTKKWFASRRWALAAAALLLFGMVCAGVAKNCRRPHSDKRLLVSAVAQALQPEVDAGILLDFSSAGARLIAAAPKCEFVFKHHRQPDENVFWRELGEFIRIRQVERKNLYVLLQTPRPGNNLQEFRAAALREWGMLPFTELFRFDDKQSSYELLRYEPPRRLFGLRVSTPECPDPDGPFLPPEIAIQRGEPFELKFSQIITDARYCQWGGVEVDSRFGVTDDFSWRFTPDAKTPESFPLEITLYAPNHWPTGYAKTTIRVVDQSVEPLPELANVPRELDWDAKPEAWARNLPVPPEILGDAETSMVPCFDELGNVPGDHGGEIVSPKVRQVAPEAREQTIFWIGSRVWGTPWITERLQKDQPKWRIYRLEEHPKLSYSGDPRYTFLGLSTPRKPENPLLNASGAVDWRNYRQQQNLPAFDAVVLALGYEEVMLEGKSNAFHLDRAMSSLQKFLDALQKDAPTCRVLVVLPGMPSLQQKSYFIFAGNRYFSNFRHTRRHSYRRLVEALFAVADKYPQVTVLPTYLWVPSGSNERDARYQKVIQLYLQDLGNQTEQR